MIVARGSIATTASSTVCKAAAKRFCSAFVRGFMLVGILMYESHYTQKYEKTTANYSRYEDRTKARPTAHSDIVPLPRMSPVQTKLPKPRILPNQCRL